MSGSRPRQSPPCVPLVCEKFAENPEFRVGNLAVNLEREISHAKLKCHEPPPPAPVPHERSCVPYQSPPHTHTARAQGRGWGVAVRIAQKCGEIAGKWRNDCGELRGTCRKIAVPQPNLPKPQGAPLLHRGQARQQQTREGDTQKGIVPPLTSPPFCRAGSPPRGGGGNAPPNCTIVSQCKSSVPCKNFFGAFGTEYFLCLLGQVTPPPPPPQCGGRGLQRGGGVENCGELRASTPPPPAQRAAAHASQGGHGLPPHMPPASPPRIPDARRASATPSTTASPPKRVLRLGPGSSSTALPPGGRPGGGRVALHTTQPHIKPHEATPHHTEGRAGPRRGPGGPRQGPLGALGHYGVGFARTPTELAGGAARGPQGSPELRPPTRGRPPPLHRCATYYTPHALRHTAPAFCVSRMQGILAVAGW